MDIAWFRDLIICISGILAIIVLVLFTVLVITIYRKSKSVLHSLESISNNIQDISSVLREKIITPFAEIGTFIHGISKVFETLNKTFRKKEGGKHDG